MQHIIERFSVFYFIEAASRSAANAYLALMALCYVVVIALIATQSPYAHQIAIATGLTDIILHFSRRVKTRLPASIPLGISGGVAMILIGMRLA